MTRQPTRASRFLALALAFALASVSPAICFAATLQTEERQQHASCPMGQESHSPETAKLDCCIGQSPQFAGITQDTVAPLVAAAAVVGVITATPESLNPALSALPTFDPELSKPSRTPTYLLVSVFRL